MASMYINYKRFDVGNVIADGQTDFSCHHKVQVIKTSEGFHDATRLFGLFT
jgi:hypothetical protein